VLVEAVAVGRAVLAGGAHSDASWSISEVDGALVRWDTNDGVDHVVQVDVAEVRRLVEAHGAGIVRWRPAAAEVGTAELTLAAWPVVDEETWSWSLHRSDDGRLVLVVVCGSVGIYERAVLLDGELVRAHERHGRRVLEVLAAEVRSTR
jgi:hypothetical protein